MDTLIIPRLLLIASTARNSGKTTLGCQIISKFSDFYPIVGLKISPHSHKRIQSGKIIMDTGHIYITEETDRTIMKDSARMLSAGVRKSYFIMADQNHTGEAFYEVFNMCSEKDFFICESGGLRNFVVPGVFLMIQNTVTQEDKPLSKQLKQLSDCLITFEGQKLDFNIDDITISENRWKLQKLIV